MHESTTTDFLLLCQKRLHTELVSSEGEKKVSRESRRFKWLKYFRHSCFHSHRIVIQKILSGCLWNIFRHSYRNETVLFLVYSFPCARETWRVHLSFEGEKQFSKRNLFQFVISAQRVLFPRFFTLPGWAMRLSLLCRSDLEEKFHFPGAKFCARHGGKVARAFPYHSPVTVESDPNMKSPVRAIGVSCEASTAALLASLSAFVEEKPKNDSRNFFRFHFSIA